MEMNNLTRITLLMILIMTTTFNCQADSRFSAVSTSVGGANSFSLDGDWKLVGYSPDKSKKLELTADVPGQVHIDLEKAKIIPSMFWRDNAEQCQWPEYWDWSYKKEFDLPQDFLNETILLQFDGLDTYSEIYLNGRIVGKTDNMFLPYEYNISKNWLLAKHNVLEVKFSSIYKHVSLKGMQKPLPSAFGDPYRSYVRRIQCTFGWDWVNRFVSAGIWRPCRIVSFKNARVEDLFAYTKSIDNNQATLELEVSNTIKNSAASSLIVQIYNDKGVVVWENKTVPDTVLTKLEAKILNPELWWPNGAGAQALYKITASLLDKNEGILFTKTITTGIRTIAVEELKDKEIDGGSSFSIVVNGVHIYAKGGNWVPADAFPSRVTPQKYEMLIRQLKEGNMNMLRSWGGGIYEPQAFWDACNKMGIMVSQDLLMACANYPEEDPKFVSSLKKEFTANIKLLRNNPSLIFWCGDNELGFNNKPSDSWPSKKLHEAMTIPLLSKLDPSRPFRITSPLSQDPKANNSMISGDCHIGAYYTDEIMNGNLVDYRDIISKYVGRFISEYATCGTPPKRSLLRFMTEEDLKNNEMLEYHTKDNPYTKGGLTLNRHLERTANTLYGNPGEDVDRKLRQMEYVQYDFTRQAMENSRRQMGYNSGILFWMFNDCWAASGWSMVDFWGGRKASWYAAAAGSRPIIAAPEKKGNSLKWWLSNTQIKDAKAEVVVKVQPFEGAPRWSKHFDLTIPANSSMLVTDLVLAEMKSKMGDDAILVCEVKYENGYDRSYWAEGLPSEIKYPKTNLKVQQKKTNQGGEITISADKWARVVTLDADADFEDNYFEMLPGETRSIKWKSREGCKVDKISVKSWND